MIPLAISTATATYVGRLFFGPYPSFVIPALETPCFHVANFWLLLSFVGLGILLGIVSAVYIKSIYAFEDFFDQRIKGNYYTRHMTGMLLVGAIMYLLMFVWGHYYIEGVGYATIQDVLTDKLSAFYLLLLLFVLKLLVTSLTLGSGASGGIFSPSLFMGATLGAAYGIALTWCFPAMDKSVAGFAIAGMAGVVGGATGAMMAAIVMIFEMTLDCNVIIPITITVALSYGVRKVLCPESIYTLKLTRRGHHMPSALHANFSDVKHVKDIMQTGITALPASSTLDAFAKTVLEHPEQSHFLVHDGDRIVGLVGREAAVGALDQPHSAKTIGQVANTQFVVVSADAMLADLLGEMYANGVSVALVATNGKAPSITDIQGVVTEYETAEVLVRSVDLFCD
jgi:CIC family chloride channel protein